MNNRNVMAVLALVLIAGSTAQAGEGFRKKHPRRAEVNRNVRRERREIKRDVKQGKISADQGKQDLQNLKNVKQQEVADVKANGGHLTREEQKGLNQELRANQKQINGQIQGGSAPAANTTGN